VSADAIRERLAALREAGAALAKREASSVLDSLGRVLDGWRRAEHGWRAALESELPKATGFSAPMVRAGLDCALAEWNSDALRTLVDSELGAVAARHSGFPVTSVLMAGSIPMPTLLAAIAPLALRSPVLVKPASRDPVTPRLVARSIAETDAQLGACIEIVDFDSADDACARAFASADCVSATGSDATIGALRSLVSPPRRLVCDGHRLSLAVVSLPADAQAVVDLARRLAFDVAIWDQLGCLSPIEIFCVGEGDAADRLSEALADALREREETWPRGDIGAEAASDIARERAEAEVRAAAERPVRVLASDTTAWTVIREDTARLRAAPLHRFVRVVPVPDLDALQTHLVPYGAHLAGVAIAGFGDDAERLTAALTRLGASRICAPGRLQAPPLAWHHGGRAVLAPLARFTDVETR